MRCKKCRLKNCCRQRKSKRSTWEVQGDWAILSWSLYLCFFCRLWAISSVAPNTLVLFFFFCSLPASLRRWCSRNNGKKFQFPTNVLPCAIFLRKEQYNPQCTVTSPAVLVSTWVIRVHWKRYRLLWLAGHAWTEHDSFTSEDDVTIFLCFRN